MTVTDEFDRGSKRFVLFRLMDDFEKFGVDLVFGSNFPDFFFISGQIGFDNAFFGGFADRFNRMRIFTAGNGKFFGFKFLYF